MKGLKLVFAACLALVFCFTLASCNKGTCSTCHKENVSRHKVTNTVLGNEVTSYLCDDCYQAWKELKSAVSSK